MVIEDVQMPGESVSATSISVILPVYNASKFVKEAIQSVLDQTFTDFELIVINDGSSDESLKIIRSFTDSRIQVINNPNNLGLIATLNLGISIAKGKYIARMDADDISLPHRFQKQFDFLEANPSVGVLGTAYQTIEKNPRTIQHPLESQTIKEELLFTGCVLAHPTIMMRQKIFQDIKVRYDSRYIHAEDYALWANLSHTALLRNLAEICVLYRCHERQISIQYSLEQEQGSWLVKALLLSKLLRDSEAAEVQNGLAKILTSNAVSVAMLETASEIFIKLVSANRLSRHYPQKKFEWFLLNIWYRVWLESVGRSFKKYFLYPQTFKLKRASLRLLFLVTKSKLYFKSSPSFRE
jgi:glycosyltransferase involved in cell wall biosynthesis